MSCPMHKNSADTFPRTKYVENTAASQPGESTSTCPALPAREIEASCPQLPENIDSLPPLLRERLLKAHRNWQQRVVDELPSEPGDFEDTHITKLDSKEDYLEESEEYKVIPGESIPATGRGNSDDGSGWLNPSAGQLYRSLKRKNKPIAYSDALDVAAVHAMVTSSTWDAIMEYEELHSSSCESPKLARFHGMDGIYSVKAKLRHYLLRQPWPYDRHDWVVNRCGEEVRYIIDYYSYPCEGDEEMYTIDARPAPSNLGNIFDRVRLGFRKLLRFENPLAGNFML